MREIVRLAHESGALLVVAANPIALGLLRGPGDQGADIVVGEGQPLGLGLTWRPARRVLRLPQGASAPGSGPARRCHHRRPGSPRLHADPPDPRAAYPPREGDLQHLHEPGALHAGRHHLPGHLLGRAGLREVAEQCLRKAHYAQEVITDLPASPRRSAAHSSTSLWSAARRRPGRSRPTCASAASSAVTSWAATTRSSADCMLFCVTEKRTRAEIDTLAETLAEIGAQPELPTGE